MSVRFSLQSAMCVCWRFELLQLYFPSTFECKALLERRPPPLTGTRFITFGRGQKQSWKKKIKKWYHWAEPSASWDFATNLGEGSISLCHKGWFPEISLAGQRHLILVDANGKANFAQHGDLENSTVTNFSHRGELAKTDYY